MQQYDDSSVKAEDAAANMSAGASDKEPATLSADAAATEAPAKGGGANRAVNPPGKELQIQARTQPTPTRTAFRHWSRETTVRQPGGLQRQGAQQSEPQQPEPRQPEPRQEPQQHRSPQRR